jgi:hypothetical protein
LTRNWGDFGMIAWWQMASLLALIRASKYQFRRLNAAVRNAQPATRFNPRFHQTDRQHRRPINGVIATLATPIRWQFIDEIWSLEDGLFKPGHTIKFYKQQVALLGTTVALIL